jgi:hypothetical protein
MSTSSEPVERLMTVVEFLAYGDGRATRYELVGGRLIAMNPPAVRHAVIGENIGRALERPFRPPCRVFWMTVGVAQNESGSDLFFDITSASAGFILGVIIAASGVFHPLPTVAAPFLIGIASAKSLRISRSSEGGRRHGQPLKNRGFRKGAMLVGYARGPTHW